MARFNLRVSVKHLQIDKANSSVLLAAAITCAIVVFSLVAARSLLTQMSYQRKVIGLRDKANNQLEKNIKATAPLVAAYQTFEDASESVIGTADKNSKIILDALPSKYDFPALTTSLEGVITSSGLKINSIVGTDNEVSAEQDSLNPKYIEVPFEISATGNYASAKQLVLNLERSIRPIKITSLSLSGDTNNLKVDIKAITYYQPAKKLGIEQKIIKGNEAKTKASTTKVQQK